MAFLMSRTIYSDMVNRKIAHIYNDFIIKTVKIEFGYEINTSEINNALRGDFRSKI